MTPKDPQAELRDEARKLADEYLDPFQPVDHTTLAHKFENAILALFQAHQQQLLSDLLKKKVLHAVKPGKKEYAVPVEAITSKIGELNG